MKMEVGKKYLNTQNGRVIQVEKVTEYYTWTNAWGDRGDVSATFNGHYVEVRDPKFAVGDLLLYSGALSAVREVLKIAEGRYSLSEDLTGNHPAAVPKMPFAEAEHIYFRIGSTK
jgi:hypothetical protein